MNRHAPTQKYPDWLLAIPVIALLSIGMVMVYSASGAQSRDIYGDSQVIFFKQSVALGAGLFALLIGVFFNHNLYRHPFILFPALFVVV